MHARISSRVSTEASRVLELERERTLRTYYNVHMCSYEWLNARRAYVLRLYTVSTALRP